MKKDHKKCTKCKHILHISLFTKDKYKKSGMSWENWGKGQDKWQIDHKIAFINFDLTKREELLKACHYTNMQPLWHKDHKKKTAVDIQEKRQKEVTNASNYRL